MVKKYLKENKSLIRFYQKKNLLIEEFMQMTKQKQKQIVITMLILDIQMSIIIKVKKNYILGTMTLNTSKLTIVKDNH